MKAVFCDTSCFECQHKGFGKILDSNAMKIINKNNSQIHFSTDQTIIHQGSFVSQIIFLKKGVVKIVLEGHNRDTIIKLVEEDNFVALPVLSGYSKYPFSVVTVTECEACLISIKSLNEIMKADRAIYEHLMNWYSDDFLFMYEKMSIISTRNSHGKLASALLYLSDHSFKNNILDLLSRKDLAELATTSVESTNKILQQMHHDGIISIERNKIKIKRRDLIEKLSTVG